jgi:hypothetical protein
MMTGIPVATRLARLLAALACYGLAWTTAAQADAANRFILGQDLGTVRDYLASDCCPHPDGTTFYVDLYSLLDPKRGFGGLGVDADGRAIEQDQDYGSGLQNGWRQALVYPGGVAIGLQMVENHQPAALAALLAGVYD